MQSFSPTSIWRRLPLIFAFFVCRMSAIFLFPVCFSYWPRKCTTRDDPDVDNSHQLWSRSFLYLWVIMRDNVSHWLLLKMHTRSLRMRRITWPVSRGSKQLHFWNTRPRFAYSLYNFYWATTTIKGRLLSTINANALDSVNFLCVTLWPSPLTFWPWTVVVHGGSRDQPCHQILRP